MAIWDRVRKLFAEAEESSPGNPAVHEMLVRSPEEEIAYAQWRKTGAGARLFDWLAEEYGNFLSRSKRGDDAIAFLDTPSSKGFILYFHRLEYRPEEIRHFFQLLKERVQALDYRVGISDRIIYSRPSWVEKVERHYLKPRSKFVEGEPVRQAYGNIAIELESRDDAIHHLRLRATIYQDALYEKGHSFGGLIEALTKPNIS
ncbi:MAG: hypothetical protein AAFY91_16915 [Bacteroidota bacterium]